MGKRVQGCRTEGSLVSDLPALGFKGQGAGLGVRGAGTQEQPQPDDYSANLICYGFSAFFTTGSDFGQNLRSRIGVWWICRWFEALP